MSIHIISQTCPSRSARFRLHMKSESCFGSMSAVPPCFTAASFSLSTASRLSQERASSTSLDVFGGIEKSIVNTFCRGTPHAVKADGVVSPGHDILLLVGVDCLMFGRQSLLWPAGAFGADVSFVAMEDSGLGFQSRSSVVLATAKKSPGSAAKPAIRSEQTVGREAVCEKAVKTDENMSYRTTDRAVQ